MEHEVNFVRLPIFGQFKQFGIKYVSQELNKLSLPMSCCTLRQYRLWSFQGRDTKLERSLAKNQYTQRKSFLRIEVVASCQKLGIILENKII